MKYRSAFTIVELIVVIGVIGVIATISFVTYAGVRQKAVDSALQSDLATASRILGADLGYNTVYPSSLLDAFDGKGLPASEGTTYQYTVNNSTSPPSYCLTATSHNTDYYISNGGKPTAGACTGHASSNDPTTQNVSEPFAVLPTDIDKAADVVLDNTLGQSAPSLRSDGSSSWWFGKSSSRWYVDGNFDYTADFIINPDGSTARDILNFAFWCSGSTSTGSPSGFMFRQQVNGSDSRFFVISNGTHSPIGSTNMAAVSPNTWYQMHISTSGAVATATITRKSDSVVHGSMTLDLTPWMTSGRTTAGLFGQHRDGAGTTSGSRIDNINITK